jgi:hypothetical protein
MLKNPYKFQGPLDPIEDSLVCAPRKDDVDFIIEKISRQEYVAIQGPRQIGKTTLLFLVKNQFKHADYAYINFEVAPIKKEKDLYQWLVHQILEKIPCRKKKFTIKGEYPDVSFIDFLKNFNPKREKIILLFDEIDRLDFLKGFLHVWRDVYHENFAHKNLPSYTLITTSSIDLIRIPSGANSPFNISNTRDIKDLLENESEDIINVPFKKLKIKITPDAKKELLSQISGHPQLLQNACHLLVEKAKSKKEKKKEITENDVVEAIERLKIENSVLRILDRDINEYDDLKNLVNSILEKKEKKIFHPYKDFSLLGAGAIKEEKSSCKIRNAVYEKFIIDILKNPVEESIVNKVMRDKKKEKVEYKRIPTNSTHSGRKDQKKMREKLAKLLIYVFGFLALISLSIALLVQPPLQKFILMILSGISASLAVGVLISPLSEEKNEIANKDN